MGQPGEGPGVAAPDAYVPRMMDLEYTPEEDPSLFPEPTWAGDPLEVGAFHELPGSFVEPFDDNNHRVRPIPQGNAYANHAQVTQATTAAGDPKAVSPLPAGPAHWGLRGRGPEAGPPSRLMEQGVTWR